MSAEASPLIIVVRWEDFALLTDEELERAWIGLGEFVRVRSVARRRQQEQDAAKESA